MIETSCYRRVIDKAVGLKPTLQRYNHRRPHQALGMKTPAEAYALAA
jgi:transposase InsO family protein